MQLSSFKQILLKKSDPYVASLIKHMKDEFFAELVIESLEKMAFQKDRKRSENGAVKALGSFVTQEHTPDESGESDSPTKEMLYDNLSHHISHYKNAIDKGDQETANQHARKIFDNLHLSKKLDQSTGGSLGLVLADVRPWERNKFTSRVTEPKANKKVGDFATDTRGFDYRGKDFSFLQQPPHESHTKEIKSNNSDPQFEGQDFRHGYPLEHIKMGGKYVDVQPVSEDTKGFKPHFFDEHPIFQHFNDPPKNRTAEQDLKFIKDHEGFVNKHADNFADYREKMETERPSRGSAKGESVHGQHPTPLNLESPGQSVSSAHSSFLDDSGDHEAKMAVMEQEYRDMGFDDNEIKSMMNALGNIKRGVVKR